MPTKYEIGRAFEYEVCRHMRSLGWWANRTPGSKTSGDIIANMRGRVFYIQCQKHKPFARAKIERLKMDCKWLGWIPCIAYKDKDKKLRVEEI